MFVYNLLAMPAAARSAPAPVHPGRRGPGRGPDRRGYRCGGGGHLGLRYRHRQRPGRQPIELTRQQANRTMRSVDVAAYVTVTILASVFTGSAAVTYRRPGCLGSGLERQTLKSER
jgi:hypothetical protein